MPETGPVRLKALLVSLTLLLVLLTSGFVVWQSIREHDLATAAADRQLLGSARALAEHAGQSLAVADRALASICSDIEREGGIARLREQQVHALLKARVSGIRQVGSSLVINAHGRGIANSHEYPLQDMQVADREYFRYHRENRTNKPYLGRPVKSRVLDTWVFTISRRLNTPDGSFAGLAAVSFQVDYFDQFYQSVSIHQELQTLLLRTDGWPLAVTPANEAAFKINIKDKLLLSAYIHQQPFGVFRNHKALLDNLDRQIAFARLDPPFKNLVAVVSLPREAILADWQRQMAFNAGGALFLMSTSVALAVLLVRRLKDLEQKEAEVTALNERLTLATEAGGLGVWDWDVPRNRLHWDSQMCRLYGIDLEQHDVGYQTWKSALHPDDRERAETLMQSALQGETAFDLEFRILRADTGEIRHLRGIGQVRRTDDGTPVRMVGVNLDITLHKLSEVEYQTLLNATMDGFWLNDMQGRILDVNDAYCKLTGYSRAELLTMSIPQLEAQEEPEETAKHIAKIVSEGSDRFETLHRHKNGTILNVEISTSYLPVGDGRLVVFARDISGRKRAELSLSLALEAAEAANTAKSRFLANVSHEIRTPLNAIVGMTHLLAQGELSEHQREQVSTVESASRTLLAIINDLLDISRIEAGRIELEHIPFKLSRLLAEQTAMISSRAEEKGLSILCTVAPEIPDSLEGDPLRLGQILANLLSNAVKFTEKGTLMLSVGLDGMKDGELLLCFQVQDSGIGIPQNRLREVFSPFTQSDNSIARRYGGTGLGLAISSQLVKLMGGEIGVESEEGKGSIFFFTVPLKPVKFEVVPHCAEPATTPDEKAAAAPELPALDQTNLRLLLKELDRDLTRQSMGALNKFKQLAELLHGRFTAEMTETQAFLDQLDFVKAGQCLLRLAEKLEIPYR